MLRIKAFQGLRPAAGSVEEVACVPYDVVNREESAALAAGKPKSLLHVDRAEIDLPAEVDPYAAEVYAKAKENFLRLQQDGTLERESEPCVYLYQQRMGSHVQTGVVAVCHIDDYEQDLIKKHEKTRKDKEDDRTRLIDTLSADTGPVFLTYRDVAEIDTLVLGCTHYPLLRAAIAQVMGPAVALVDSAEATAEAVEVLLRARGLLRAGGEGQQRYFVTDLPDRFGEVGARFLGRPVVGAEQVDL